jgi:hypothetical protein
MATGSINDLNGPFIFIGETENAAGGYRAVSKLYSGNAAPTISNVAYGTVLDGTPFYAAGNETLYILSSGGNTALDLTGNIEGNTISGVTINNLESTNVSASFFTGSFKGDGSNLTNIPATGVTGLNLSRIASGAFTASISDAGGFQVNTDTSITGALNVDGSLLVTGSSTLSGNTYTQDIHGLGGEYLILHSDQYVQMQYDGPGGSKYLWVDENGISAEGNTSVTGSLSVSGDTTFTGSLTVSGNEYVDNVITRTGNQFNALHLNGGTYGAPDVELTSTYAISLFAEGGRINLTGSVNIDGDTSVTGALVVSNGSATFDQGLVAQNSNMLLTSGSNLIVQNYGNVQTDYLRGTTQEYNYLSLNGNGVNGQPGVELSSVGDISLWAEGGTVNVTGSLRVTGDIIFSGSINLGDYSGDTVNFNGEISSSIIPQTGSSFDLGSSGQTWANVYADTAHFNNIALNSISFSGLTEGRVVTVGSNGSLVDSDHFNWNTGSNQLGVSGSIKLNDSGYIYNDGPLYFEDTTNGIQLNGGNSSYFTINSNGYSNLYSNQNGVDIEAAGGGQLWLWADSNDVWIGSYDNSQLHLNADGGEGNVNIGNGNNNLNINSNTYIDNDKRIYVNNLQDNVDNLNYLQLRGWNTDDGYWWESGNGADTTLLNNENNNNVNILQTNNGNVNIDATNGSVNIHSQNGMNITGSLVVSDGAGVFNSSLIANNSNLTLDNGSNIEMNAGHVYFNEGCGDIYYNTGNDRLSIYNDCGGINLSSNTYTSNNMYFEDGNTLFTNYVGGYDGGDLNLQADGALYLYSDSDRLIQLSVNNDENGTNYLKVEQSGVNFSTYDYTSNKTHKVNLDNLGNLSFENVQIGITGSLDVSGSFNSYGVTHIHNDLYVSGNLTILGSGSVVHISSSQVDIGTNIINLNTYAPFERFAGISVYDSGSNAGVTGSLFWDSTNDVWIYANPSGSNYASARLISGPMNTGSLGDETGLTNGHFPIATGDDHISDSLLTYQGTTLALNTNKFTVDSSSGDTLIHGNFTIEGVGGVDNGDYSSYIVFRNDDNVLGFVDTADTHNVTDRLLGYNSSTGVLEFSSLIDGGTY